MILNIAFVTSIINHGTDWLLVPGLLCSIFYERIPEGRRYSFDREFNSGGDAPAQIRLTAKQTPQILSSKSRAEIRVVYDRWWRETVYD